MARAVPEGVARALRALGVADAKILVTSVIPNEPALVKLLLKARGVPKPEIKAHLQQMIQSATA